MPDRVGDSLVARGVLARKQKKTLGLFTRTVWPQLDGTPEQQLRAGLAQVLTGRAAPTPRHQLLIPLLNALGLIKPLVDKPDRKIATRTAEEIAQAVTVITAGS